MDIGKSKRKKLSGRINKLYGRVDDKTKKSNIKLINVANIVLYHSINITIDGVLIMIDDHYDEI